MTDTRAIDEATGLPLLPPTEFWRVTNEAGGYAEWDALELRTYAPRWYNRNRSIVVKWTQIEYLNAEGILEAAYEILESFDADAADAKFYGDYPPKRLEQ